MAIGAVAAIAAALVGAGVSIWSTNKQNEATAAAGAQSFDIANKNLAMQKEQQAYERSVGERALETSASQYAEEMAYKKQQDAIANARSGRGEMSNDMQSQWQRGIDLINSNQTLQDRLAQTLGKR
jgi:hypothetical protein